METKSNFELKIDFYKMLYPSSEICEKSNHTFIFDRNECTLIILRGKSTKPLVKLVFGTFEMLKEYANAFIKKAATAQEIEKQRIEAIREETNKLFVSGALLLCSWGYEQTNVSFFQILERNGSKALIVEVDQSKKLDSSDYGTTSPIKNSFKGNPFAVRISNHGIKLSSYQQLFVWNGKPVYWSSYA